LQNKKKKRIRGKSIKVAKQKERIRGKSIKDAKYRERKGKRQKGLKGTKRKFNWKDQRRESKEKQRDTHAEKERKRDGCVVVES
jgi:hypothetical protein